MSITPTPSDNDEDFDIYGDLLDVTVDVEKAKQNTEDDQIVKEQVSQLLSNLDTLRKQNKKLQESNRNLSCNISVLYNTAATEIERKDEVIADLRRQVDNLLFRRGGKKSASHTFPNLVKPNADLDVEALKTTLQQRLKNDTVPPSAISSPVLELVAGNRQLLSEPQGSSRDGSEVVKERDTVLHVVSAALKDTKVQSVAKTVPTKREISKHVTVINNESAVDSKRSTYKPRKSASCKGIEIDTVEKKSVWDRLGCEKIPFKQKQKRSLETEKKSVDSCSSGKAVRVDKLNEQLKDQPTEESENTESTGCEKIPFKQRQERSLETKNKPVDSCSSGQAVRVDKLNEQLIDQPTEESENTESSCVNSSSDKALTDKKPKCQLADKQIKESKSSQTSCFKSKQNAHFPLKNNAISAEMKSQPEVPMVPMMNCASLNSFDSQNCNDCQSSVNTQIDCDVTAQTCLEHGNNTKTSIKNPDLKLEEATSQHIVKLSSENVTKVVKCAENNVQIDFLKSQSQLKIYQLPKEHSKQLQPYQPPLPKEDPAPLPPLPMTTPPPTPVKSPVNQCPLQSELKKRCLDVMPQEHKDDLKTTSMDSPKETRLVVSGIPFNISTGNPQINKNVSTPRWSDENLHMQCPFKPRRRAKSIIVLEDATEVSNQILSDSPSSLKPDSNIKVATVVNICKSPDGRYKKSPLKKCDASDNRVSWDFRSHVTQRPMYSSRHLSSVKSFAHMPERRSPSELLNGRSGRVERIPHEDKIRVRLRDRRSRSLSPQVKRASLDESRTRNGRYEISTKESNRRVQSHQENKSDARQVLNRKKSSSLEKTQQSKNDREQINKPKPRERLMEELFGESSPESERKGSKQSNPCINSNLTQHKADSFKQHCDVILPVSVSPLPQKTSTTVEKSSLSNSQRVAELLTSERKNKIHDEDIVILRHRPRSNVRFENSESSPNNTHTTNTVICKSSSPLVKENNEAKFNSSRIALNEPQGSSTPLTDEQKKISSQPNKELQHTELTEDNKEEHKNSSRRPIETKPLYFREQDPKSNVSDESFQDADSFCDSDETSSSADSDVTYNPKRPMARRKPMKRCVRPRR